MPAADPESVARAQRHAAAPAPPDRRASPARRGIRQYVSDGWRLGGVALRLVLVNRPVRRFMLVAAVGVTLFTAALAVVAVALRRRGGPLEYELATLGFYYGLAVATTAASVGLAAVATQVLDGRSTEPRDGWRRIVSRRRTIAGWGLVEVAVGVPARLLGKWGVEQLSVILLGFGWELLRFFAIPVIALTGAGTAASARRSLQLVRRRWGDAVSGMV